MITGNIIAVSLLLVAAVVAGVMVYSDLTYPDPSSSTDVSLDEGIKIHEHEHPFLLYPRRYEAMSAASRRRRRKAGPVLASYDKDQTVIEADAGADCHTCGETHCSIGPAAGEQYSEQNSAPVGPVKSENT